MPEADALSKRLGARGLALSSPACTVLGGVSEEHLGEGEEKFPSVVRVVVSVCCGVREDVLAESCHEFGAGSAALWGMCLAVGVAVSMSCHSVVRMVW